MIWISVIFFYNLISCPRDRNKCKLKAKKNIEDQRKNKKSIELKPKWYANVVFLMVLNRRPTSISPLNIQRMNGKNIESLFGR